VRAPGLLGRLDDPSGFEPASGRLRELWRRMGTPRFARTDTLWPDLAWWIVQQRVRLTDAADQWRRLVLDLGAPAPGAPGVMTPPETSTIAALPYHRFHGYGIERQRAANLQAAARAAPALQPLVDGAVAEALPRLMAVPGVGAWTATCIATHTWGDADTVVVGDVGIPAMVAWVLAGERTASDERLVELLDPYRPHRGRVVRLVMTAGVKPPRRAPHRPPNDIRRR
jgi:3-methyladenine DNA glycosylase/8-oxoguanine DNA glycosylase